MVKDAKSFNTFLSKKGCTKITRNNKETSKYETKDGKAFTIYTKTDSGLYSTYTLKGVKIEEIAWG